MKNERTLAFQLSKKMTVEELKSVSAAGWSRGYCANGSYQNGQFDVGADVTVDC